MPRARSEAETTRSFKAVLKRLSVPSWIVDDRGVFVWINDAFVAVFGDRLGEHLSTIIEPRYLDGVRRAFARKRDGEDSVVDYVVEGTAEDGRRVRMDISCVRLDASTFCAAVFGVCAVAPAGSFAHLSRLTPRQREVLGLLAQGASTEQIAASLVLSRATVRNHIRDILRALNAHSRLEAVVKARSLKLVSE
jgi:PAS domain S-box-containing protein